MLDGFYWLKLAGSPPEVVEIFYGDMYRCGSDVTCHLVNDVWVEMQEPMEVEQLRGPLVPPPEMSA